MKTLFYILLLIFTGISARAQETYSISGKVTDEKGETLPGAIAFLTNSKVMTSVNSEGTFNLNGLQPGTYELVVKMLGYTSYNRDVTLQKQPVTISVKLSASTTTLNEVFIKAKADPDRNKYLKLFIKNFIGESANAAQCKIVNPEAIKLHYDKDKGILEARSDNFIIIENKALGYKINYLLTHFEYDTNKETFAYEGKPYFEELTGTDNQQKQWTDNRKIAYQGSIRHFFRALFNNTAEAEGFLVYRLGINTNRGKVSSFNNLGRDGGYQSKSRSNEILSGKPISSSSLLSVIDNNFRLLKLNTVHEPGDSTQLFVVYTKEEEPAIFYNSSGHIDLPVKPSTKKSQVSNIYPIKDGILLDNNGTLSPANNIIFNGYWTWERVADLMPSDYLTTAPKPVAGKLLELTAALDSFRTKVPVEKVHIQFDKPYYSLGDTIWIKAYVVQENNELSNSSRLLYADLINDKDSVKTSLRLPLTGGLAWGSVTLNDSLLQAGNYHIRAYTNLMRNLGEEYFFDKAIRIGNALPPVTHAATQPSPKTKQPAVAKNDIQAAGIKVDPANITVQFFPEGGELVNDLISKIGFKAVGADGLSREVSGYVADQNNRQLTTFQSEHAGMGTFMLQPVAGNTYTTVIKLADGNEKRFNLPKAKDQGYALSVRQDDENIIVNVQVSSALLNSGEITLIAQQNNTIQYTGKKELAHTGLSATIPKSRFSEGILQFTLFSPGYQPVAERLVFIRKADDHLNIKLTPDKKEYTKRGAVHLNLKVTDQDGKPVSGAFSLAVTDGDKVPFAEDDEKTIFSNLLLTADLKGYVEHPNYYFTAITPNKDKQLDNLLLTQGWRRFVWSDILNGKFPDLTYQPEKGRGISGRIVTDKGKPVDSAKVSLLINIGNGATVDTVTNAEGRFNFDFPFSKGTTYNVAVTDAKHSKDLKVEIDKQQIAQPVTLKHLPDEQPDNNFTTYLDNSRKRFDEMKNYGLLNNRSIVLKEVKINEKMSPQSIREIAVQHSQNLAGPGNADIVLTFVDLATATGQFGLWLDGRLPGVRIKVNPRFPSNWIPFSNMADGPGTQPKAMTLIIDGIEQDSVMYSLLDPNQISSIEILRGGGAASLYGMHGSNGVFIITTKKGDVDYNSYVMERFHPGSTKPPGLKTYTFQDGYALRRQFYSPNYDNPTTQTQMADLRTTIYWNPNIITDENGKATIKFFNADGTGNYRIITEGLNQDGKLGRQVYTYPVK